MSTRVEHADILACIAAIPDPEIPVVSIRDLGILRSAELQDNGQWLIRITPTYSGCPAMQRIEQDIIDTLLPRGIDAKVELVLEPAWTTDWISEAGRAKLKAYGIAPPRAPAGAAVREGNHDNDQQSLPARNPLTIPLFVERHIECPRCESTSTERVSAFGATACKEQWRCLACLEPFEHFKCH